MLFGSQDGRGVWGERIHVHAWLSPFAAVTVTSLTGYAWTVAYQAPLSMGLSQARIMELVAISSSRGSSQLRD